MGSGIATVYPNLTGEYGGSKTSGGSAPSTNPTTKIGWDPSSGDFGWMGRFEIPLPLGAKLMTAEIEFLAIFNGAGPINGFVGGLLAPDGAWDSAGGNFRSPLYPTLSSLPWPEYDGGVSDPSAWYGLAPAFGLEQMNPAFADNPFILADGTNNPAAFGISGLVDQIQAFVNEYGDALRPNSVSGNDVPIAICLHRRFGTIDDPAQYHWVRLSTTSAPQLNLTWIDPIGVESKWAGIAPAVRTSPGVRSAIESQWAGVRRRVRGEG